MIMKNILGENKNLKLYNSKKEMWYSYLKFDKNLGYETTYNCYGDIMTYELKCNEKYKHLRYKSEYTRNKKGEIINYSNTNT